MAVFHHAECLLRVVPPRSETIEKVGQAVFVQCAREQQPHDEGQDDGCGGGHDLRATIHSGCGERRGEPPRERPQFNDVRIGFFLRLIDAPKGQACEEDERRKELVFPCRSGMYRELHGSEIFGDVSVVEVVHLVEHAHGRLHDGVAAERSCSFA